MKNDRKVITPLERELDLTKKSSRWCNDLFRLNIQNETITFKVHGTKYFYIYKNRRLIIIRNIFKNIEITVKFIKLFIVFFIFYK